MCVGRGGEGDSLVFFASCQTMIFKTKGRGKKGGGGGGGGGGGNCTVLISSPICLLHQVPITCIINLNEQYQ